MEETNVHPNLEPQQNPQNVKNDQPKRNYLIPRLLLWGLFLSPFIAVLVMIISLLSDLPPMEEIERPQSFFSSEVYSSDEKLLGFIHKGENRIVVDLDEVSPHVLNALMVTEDRNFYDHSGIDAGMVAAIPFRYFTKGQTSGASTITMQLARNLYDQVGKKRNLIRKVKEMIVAVLIERSFTKSEITRSYLNGTRIYGNAVGVQMAAKKLFRRNADSLSVAQSALIVGLLKGQGAFSPYKNPDKAKDRRNLIIDLMAGKNLISATDATKAKAEKIVLAEDIEDKEVDMAPYLKERVRLYMEEWGQLNGYNVYRDGLKIYTTMDTRVQRCAEEAVKEHLTGLQKSFSSNISGREPWRKDAGFLKRIMERSDRYKSGKKAGKSISEIEEEFAKPIKMKVFTWNGEKDTTMSPLDSVKYHSRFLEAGMCAMEPGTGRVKAWVGGIDYDYFKYDHVDLAKRQVGSTFKPFVYCAAIDNGRSPCERELNQPVSVPTEGGGVWVPDNAGDDYGGYITLKKALEYSLNVITARLTKQMGIRVVIDYAHMLGIESTIEPVPASCLGTSDLSVLEMTAAYSTFANKGVYIKPVFVSRIEDRDGNVIAEFDPEKRPAISDRTAYVMLEMLKGVIEDYYGTGAGLKPQYGLSGDVGGKTGTTQNSSDGWFMGVTSNLVAGTWVGCAERSMRFNDDRMGQGAYMAMPIFGRFLKKVQADRSLGYPASSFSRPGGAIANLDCDFEPVYTNSATEMEQKTKWVPPSAPKDASKIDETQGVE
ncbi:MAG: penicillin-binding protein 1A [Bacteroidia bacterium]